MLNRSVFTLGAAAIAFVQAPGAHAEGRYAAVVIDAQTKAVLHEDAADEERYPASLTKMMTLYLLFEAIDHGEVALFEPITISRNAAAQPPSRLGVRAGEQILVDDAIRALVTKSANDVAVAVAEHLAGSEARFAARMTARAREIGMGRTRFVNASGLPDSRQQTTARDIATLSQALIEDYPQYYGFFQTPGMSWKRVYARNHNRLLGVVEGVDGIKTGYTNASGFNLASSAARGGHRLIAVVLGGETALARDNQMRYLIEEGFASLSASTSVGNVRLASLPVDRVSIDPATGRVRVERVAADGAGLTGARSALESGTTLPGESVARVSRALPVD